MANKKVSQLTSKPSVLTTDLFPIADPSTGQLFKTTISDLGTAIGSGVSSVNSLVGAVVLDTDDIQELVSPTNKWFTDTRARAAISAGTGISYNSGTGVITNAVTSGQIATALGYTPANDASVVKLALEQIITASKYFSVNSSSPALTLANSGTGYGLYAQTKSYFQGSAYFQGNVTIQSVGANSLVKLDGDQNLDTAVAGTDYVIPSALNSYLPLAGGTLTGALNGTSATFTGDLTISSTNPRIYLTDTDNNPDYFISNTDGTFTVYDVTNSLSRFTIGTTGNAYFRNAITGGGSITGESVYSNGIISAGTSLSVGTFVSAGGSLTGSALYVTGMTAGSGAIYHTGSRLTFANYNTSGTLHFEVNGGNGALTLNADTSASFVAGASFGGALSGTSATFSGDITIGTIGNSSSGYHRGSFNGTNTSANLSSVYFSGGDGSQNRAGLKVYQTWGGTYTDTCVDLFVTKGGVGGTTALSINGLGAATFSSSVTAGIITSNISGSADNTSTFEGAGSYLHIKGRANYSKLYFDGASSTLWSMGVEGGSDFQIRSADTTPRVWITNSGNVGIGTTSPSGELHVKAASGFAELYVQGGSSTSGMYLFDQNTESGLWKVDSGYMAFGTSNTERMRITSGGKLLVNRTATIFSNSGHTIQGEVSSGGEPVLEVYNQSLSNSSPAIACFKNSITTNSDARFIQFYADAGTVAMGGIVGNGTSNVQFASISDIRKKQNINKLDNSLNKIMGLNPVSFNWISNNEFVPAGFIAQEVEEVFPEYVVQNMEEINGVTYKGLTGGMTGGIVPVLVKAIQELKAELDTLKNK